MITDYLSRKERCLPTFEASYFPAQLAAQCLSILAVTSNFAGHSAFFAPAMTEDAARILAIYRESFQPPHRIADLTLAFKTTGDVFCALLAEMHSIEISEGCRYSPATLASSSAFRGNEVLEVRSTSILRTTTGRCMDTSGKLTTVLRIRGRSQEYALS